MTAYYNEFDPKAAAWLRELIKQGHIAPGKVDERSIIEVRPDDLVGYDQCHFFAGIGVWSYALRTAGWTDDRPVWTGSCPCQPFSAAGKRGGISDVRHLWPEFFRLIAECRPLTVFGEQVASKDGLTWLDAVHADLEGAGYSVGAVDTCAAGFGAPHIRQRLYFVGTLDFPVCHRDGGISGIEGREESTAPGGRKHEGGGVVQVGNLSNARLLADANDEGPQGRGREQLQERAGERITGKDGGACNLADADGRDSGAEREQRGGEHGQQPEDRGPCNGFWSNAEWIPCRDGKARPVEPCLLGDAERMFGRRGGDHRSGSGEKRRTVPESGNSSDEELRKSGDRTSVEPGPESVADGLAGELGLVRLVTYPDRPHQERIIYSPLIQKGEARVMRLRGYGNAIVAPQATAFVESYMEVIG